MVLGKNSNLKSTLIILKKDQIEYLRNLRIQKSEFFRQSVKAYQDGKWQFDFSKL